MAIDRDKILESAQKLIAKGRFDKAIVEFQKLIADDPNDARTLLRVGDLHLKAQQYAEAIAVYERVGQQYAQAGFALKAIAVYKNVREIIQKHVPHLEDRFGYIVPKLAELYTQLGLTSDALAAYDEMATRLQRLGRDRDAIDVFRKVVALDPNNPLPHLRLAEAFVRVKELDRAADAFGTAGEILLRMGRADDALRVFERLLVQQPTARFARLAAEIYLARATASDAMSALQKLQICVKENSRDLDTLELLARAFDVLGQPAKAVEVHKEAGRIARENGQRDRLAHLVQILTARAPHDDGVKQLAAQLRVVDRGGAPSTAPPSTIAPSAMPPSSAIPISVVEEVQPDEFESVDSLDSIEVEAVEYEGDEPIPLRPSRPPELEADGRSAEAQVREIVVRVDQLRNRGAHDRAIEELRVAIDRHPSFRDLRERLTDTLIEVGDQDSAVAEMLHYAGWLSHAGDAEGAARLLDEVLLLDAHNATALEMLRMLGYALPEVEHYEASPEMQPPSTTTDLFAPPSFAVPSAYDYQQHEKAYGRDAYSTTPDPYANDASDIGTAPPPASYAPADARGSYVDDPAVDPYGGLQPYSESGYTDAYGNYVDTSGQAARHPGYGPDRGAIDPSSYDPDAPLPSYDLEEVGAEQALSRHYTGAHAAVPTAMSQAPMVELDDPFGPLPSFPIDDGSVQIVDAPPLSTAMPAAGPSFSGQTPRVAIDEDALEEIDFFTQHGMIEEARNLLTEQLSRAPNHPLLLERQRELAQASSRAPATAPPPASHLDDRSFDIAASLGALDELEPEAPQAVAAKAPTHSFGEQVSVETVFEQFKAGVAAQVPDGDAATHYELGLAYKDMGLVQDAIREFEIAARDPARACVAESLIGMMHLDHGQIDPAIDAFIRGLHSAHKTPEQELALTYEVGNAYELRGNADQAVYYFQLVSRTDPSYRDGRGSVAERILRLQPQGRPAAVATSGNDGLGDDFDQAFDDLFGKN